MYFQFLIEDKSTEILVNHIMEKIQLQGFFCFFFLILICRIFSRKGKFLQEKLVVEFGWREGAKKINENFVVCFYLSY